MLYLEEDHVHWAAGLQQSRGAMKTNKEKWIFTAILAVIEIFLTAAELGFFTIGKIAFTILHIPVFIAVIEIGLLQGFTDAKEQAPLY